MGQRGIQVGVGMKDWVLRRAQETGFADHADELEQFCIVFLIGQELTRKFGEDTVHHQAPTMTGWGLELVRTDQEVSA